MVKHVAFFALLSMVILSNSFAQTKNTGKAVINTPGVHCEYCKKRLEAYVAAQDGIKSVVVDLKNKVTTVIWMPDRLNLEYVKAHIANAGYDADDVQAEVTTYNRLPAACRVKTKGQLIFLPEVDSIPSRRRRVY
jgi:copper chaperone CopZ